MKLFLGISGLRYTSNMKTTIPQVVSRYVGGINLLHHLKKQNINGVITFSTGNHGLSIATAAAWSGMEAVVVVPQNNNPEKNRAIKETGAPKREKSGFTNEWM
jgi:threonine dehydratase